MGKLPFLDQETAQQKGSKNGANARNTASSTAVQRLVVAQISGAAFVLAVADSEPLLLLFLGIITACLPSSFTGTHSTHHDIAWHFQIFVPDLQNTTTSATKTAGRFNDAGGSWLL